MFRKTCPIKVEQNELFKTHSADRSLISCNCFWVTGRSLYSFYFCKLTEGFALFLLKRKNFLLLALWDISAQHLQLRAWALVLFTCLLWNINTLFWVWDIPGGPKVGKKNLKEGGKNPLLSREKEFWIFPGQMWDVILLFHLWINSHFKQESFPLKLLLCRHIPKSLKRNVLHRNNVMYLMYCNSYQHAGLKISFISVCSFFYMLAMDNCL